MKKFILLFLLLSSIILSAKEKDLGYASSSGRWVKIVRIQNRNPIDGGEYGQFSGTLNIQTDFGQTGSSQYYAIFSFGIRGGIKPLLVEFGDASKRSASDPSRVEWRIYKDTNGWHYLWLWQSNYSLQAVFDYNTVGTTEVWSFEEPSQTDELMWSSMNGQKQGINNINDLVIDEKLGIGTSNIGDYKLAVNGKIRAKEIKVESNWADFVFKEDYHLLTLKEVEEFISENGYLPNMPSEAEVKENGIDLGEMNAKLLQKIEELTLYTIEQGNKIEKLNSLKSDNIELKERLNKIEELLKKII